MSDGKIRDVDYLRRAKSLTIYHLEVLQESCRGLISPTDIDGLYVAHCGVRGEGRGILFEFKTEGASCSAAQQSALEWLLRPHGTNAVGIIAEHPRLTDVEPVNDVLRFYLWMWVDGEVKRSEWLDGSRLPNFVFAFYDNALFLDWHIAPWLRSAP